MSQAERSCIGSAAELPLSYSARSPQTRCSASAARFDWTHRKHKFCLVSAGFMFSVSEPNIRIQRHVGKKKQKTPFQHHQCRRQEHSAVMFSINQSEGERFDL